MPWKSLKSRDFSYGRGLVNRLVGAECLYVLRQMGILTLLGNLSFLLGRKLQWDYGKGEIIGDEQA